MVQHGHTRTSTEHYRGPVSVRDRSRPPGGIDGLAVLLATTLLAPLAGAQPTTQPAAEITPAVRRQVATSLAWLASRQQPDGSFGSSGQYARHVGITALAGLAFVSDGNLPGRGRYGQVVSRAAEFIIASSGPSGLLAADTSHGPMYGHGFATLFLAELYGTGGPPRHRETLQRAVRLIVRTQNPQGGWRYQPEPVEADISVTICQLMALRAARNAGVAVAKHVIDRAVDYVRKSQNDDGGFRYMLHAGEAAYARSAAGLASLFYAGIYSGPEVDKALRYLSAFVPAVGQRPSYYFYGHYYGTQAMFLAGGEHWRRWWPAMRDELLVRNKPSADGAWSGEAGQEYGTAMALIILQVPNRLLPIFQR